MLKEEEIVELINILNNYKSSTSLIKYQKYKINNIISILDYVLNPTIINKVDMQNITSKDILTEILRRSQNE